MRNEKENKKLIICELSYYAPVFYGNFMASLFDMEEKLKTINTENKVIYVFYKQTKNCDWAKEMVKNNKEIFFIKNQKIKGFLELRKIIIENDINILHLHFNFPVIILFLLKIFKFDLKIIAHFHNTISGTPGLKYIKKIKIKMKKILYNHFIDLFCGCGEAVFKDMIKCGMNINKSCYIDNCIVYSRLNIDCEDDVKRNKLINKKIIMIIGSHFIRKGVDIAINAVKDIVQKYNIVLMIVCQNKDYVMSEIKKILSNIPDWILIAPSHDNIALYYKMSEIYLIPSRDEGFPYAQLEAIYCETLTIRSELPQMDRKLPGDISSPVNDAPALRQSIEYVLNLPDNKKKAILAEQKNYITERWNIDIWSKKIIDMYSEIVNNA